MRLDAMCLLMLPPIFDRDEAEKQLHPALHDLLECYNVEVALALCLAGSDLQPEHAKEVCERFYDELSDPECSDFNLFLAYVGVLVKHDPMNYEVRISEIIECFWDDDKFRCACLLEDVVARFKTETTEG